MKRLAFALAILAVPASAETVRIATSTVTLQPSDEPGAVAEIIFVNKPSNGPFNNGNYYLSMDGIDVTVEFEWNAMGGSDALHITVPDGLVVIPPFLAVPEGSTGRALIYSGEMPLG
jgi:hypothetical protein